MDDREYRDTEREFDLYEKEIADLRGTKNALETQVLSLMQQNADLVAALELAYEWLNHEAQEPYFETLSEKGMKAYEAVSEALAQAGKVE